MRSLARSDLPRADRWIPRILSLLVALAVCGPMLGRGYTLAYDMVFVPHPALSDRAWGVDASVPRAVPADAVLALVGRVLPMDLVQQALLLGLVVTALLGAWRAAPARSLPGAAATALVYAWNPYLGERLAMGQWSLLWGFALLPWAVVHRRRPAALGLLAIVAAVAAPTSGVLVGLAAVLVCLGRSRRGLLLVAGSAVAGNLLWIVPGMLAAGGYARDTYSAAAFAPSADSPLGRFGSLVTMGGVWNFLTQLGSRSTWISAVAGLLLVAVALLGWVRRRHDLPLAVGLLGVAGLALAGVLTTAVGQSVLTWLLAEVPGAGILRDGQKWVAWWCLAVALGVGAGLEVLFERLPVPVTAVTIAALSLVPVCVTPDLAWGVGGRLSAVPYDADFVRAAALVNADSRPGAAVVFPWHGFRAWPWNEDRTALDPWPRLLQRPTVVRDDLELVGGTVPGEDPRAAEVSRLVASHTVTTGALAALGIGWVIVDRTTAGQDGVDPGGPVVLDTPTVRVEVIDSPKPLGTAPHRVIMALVDGAVALWSLLLLGLALRRRERLEH